MKGWCKEQSESGEAKCHGNSFASQALPSSAVNTFIITASRPTGQPSPNHHHNQSSSSEPAITSSGLNNLAPSNFAVSMPKSNLFITAWCANALRLALITRKCCSFIVSTACVKKTNKVPSVKKTMRSQVWGAALCLSLIYGGMFWPCTLPLSPTITVP